MPVVLPGYRLANARSVGQAFSRNTTVTIRTVLRSAPAFALPALINLVGLVAFTRLLPLASYGHLSLALVGVEFMQGVAYTWVNLALMRFYVAPDPHAAALAVGLRMAGGLTALLLLAAGLCYALGPGLGLAGADYLPLVLLGAAGRGLGNFVQDVYRISRPTLAAYTKVTTLLNAAYYLPAVAYVGLARTISLETVLSCQVGSLGLALLGLALVHQRRLRELLRQRPQPAAYQQFVRYGGPLVGSFVALSLFLRVDRYVLEHAAGPAALGAYAAAFSLANLCIGSFFTLLTLPTYPELLRRFNAGDEAGALSLYRRNGHLLVAVGLPLLVGTGLLSGPLCQLLFGPQAAAVQPVFAGVVLSVFLFNYRVHYCEQLYQFYYRTRVALWSGLLLGGGHLLGAALLAPAWQGPGVALSGVVLNAAGIAFARYYRRRYLPAPPGAQPALA